MSPSVKTYLFNKKSLGFGINQRWVHKRSVKKNVTSKETVCVADDVRFSIVFNFTSGLFFHQKVGKFGLKTIFCVRLIHPKKLSLWFDTIDLSKRIHLWHSLFAPCLLHALCPACSMLQSPGCWLALL